MKRIFKDYQSITKEQLQLIAREYPEGFSMADLKEFNIPNKETFKGLEIKTEEVIYLFKINTKMLEAIDEFTDDDYDLDAFSDSDNYEFESGSESDDDDSKED